MTKQEMFEKAMRGLASQDWQPGYNPEMRLCLYRTPDGRKCAMGHLIDDETAAEYEGKSASYVAAYLGWPADLCEFVDKLQIVHDHAAEEGPDLRQAFVTFAERSDDVTFPEDI